MHQHHRPLNVFAESFAPNYSNKSTHSKCSQSLIMSYFKSSVSTNNSNNNKSSALCNEIDDAINVLEYEMLLHMAQLDKVELNENSIDDFFLRVADVQLKINNIRKKCAPNNSFVNLSTLPMYYNNMRSIVNKRNI